MSKRTRALPNELPIIGWREWVSLPQFGIEHIKAKVDTGARSSSLQAHGLRFFQRDGASWARFSVHPIQRSTEAEITIEAQIQEYRMVRSSNGKASERPVIITNISMMGLTWPVELTLASRDEMGFRMLLGRQAFRSRFLVDAGNSYYGGVPAAMRRNKRRKQKTSPSGGDGNRSST